MLLADYLSKNAKYVSILKKLRRSEYLAVNTRYAGNASEHTVQMH